MTIDITAILQAIITLITLLLTAFVIPWLRTKIGEAKMAEFLKWVEIGVKAAEQLYDSTMTVEKKQYVLSFLNSKGVTYTAAEVDAAIEAAVIKLHNELITPVLIGEPEPEAVSSDG